MPCTPGGPDSTFLDDDRISRASQDHSYTVVVSSGRLHARSTFGDGGRQLCLHTAARRDLDAVSDASRGRPLAAVATALLVKGRDGRLTIDLHDNTAEHLPWGGALLGGPADRDCDTGRDSIPGLDVDQRERTGPVSA